MNGAPLESLNIPPPRVEKPKTPHRVNADKIKALRNEIIHLRNIIAQLSHRLTNIERFLTSPRPINTRVQTISQTER